MKKLVVIFSLVAFHGAIAQDTQETQTTRTETTSTTTVPPRKDDEGNRGALILSAAGLVQNSVQGARNGDTTARAGLAGLVEAQMNDYVGLETGALWVNRVYSVGNGDVRTIARTDRLHIPLVVRFWPIDYLSLGAGPFVGFRVSDVYTNQGTVVRTAGTSADRNAEFGLDLAATLNFAIADKTGLFVEGRYSTVFDKQVDEAADSLSGLLGVKFDIGA